MIGQTIAHYEILALLGKGGMGEVYRARDTRLDREVAIKLLHEEVARDPERLARFRREAKVLASLSHPNIAALYGIEEFENRVFLVMELAPGSDLNDVIARGPMPVDDAARVAAQIARGLEAAHERGIVHRDLKPSNLKLSADGQLKILDFGLARVYSDDENSTTDLENSPTITAAFTAAGVILGTAAYMSPEQARGRTVDKRTDIWAFGVILWEMLTGERLFAGETVSDTLAAVLTREPDLDQLPAAMPASMRLLVQRCLERDARRRLRDIGEARLLLEDPDASSILLAGPAPAVRSRRLLPLLPWILLLALAAFALPRMMRSEPVATESKSVRRFTIEAELPAIYNTRAVEISPDGKWIAIYARDGLWMRAIDDPQPRLLVAPEELTFDESGITPFWSPDSRELAYASKGRLLRVSADGGRPNVICTLPGDWTGGAWVADGMIYFSLTRGGVYEVSARGGDPTLLFEPDPSSELDFHQPSYVVDGGGILYSVHHQLAVDAVELYRNGQRKELFRIQEPIRENAQVVNNPIYSRTGHIIYQRDQGNRGLWAVPFDAAAGEVTGTAFLIASDEGHPSVSLDGTLIHIPRMRDDNGRLIIASRDGTFRKALTEIMPSLNHPSYSPDGRRIAAEALHGQASDLFVVDLQSGLLNWLTLSPGTDWGPVWMPDGQNIAYIAPASDGCPAIWKIPADGGGMPELLVAPASDPAFAPNGIDLVITTGCDPRRGIVHRRLDGSMEPTMLLDNPAGVDSPQFSPDGRFISYRNWKSGLVSQEVAEFPSMIGRRQVSHSQTALRWSPDGRAIYCANTEPAVMMALKLKDGPNFAIEDTQELFDLDALDVVPFTTFGVSPDGSEFVLVQRELDQRAVRYFTVVENWYEQFRNDGSR